MQIALPIPQRLEVGKEACVMVIDCVQGNLMKHCTKTLPWLEAQDHEVRRAWIRDLGKIVLQIRSREAVTDAKRPFLSKELVDRNEEISLCVVHRVRRARWHREKRRAIVPKGSQCPFRL